MDNALSKVLCRTLYAVANAGLLMLILFAAAGCSKSAGGGPEVMTKKFPGGEAVAAGGSKAPATANRSGAK